jgi:8-oxo-dGTP pyrophosphatase MutT (NUDIX family)
LKPGSASELAALEAAIATRPRRPSRISLDGRIAAAVCVPLYEGPGGLEVWAIKRMEALRHHARELAFPGGKVDPADRDLLDTALRETEEELGIPRAELRVLGRLEAVPTATSRFTLNPFVVQVSQGAEIRPAAAEVAALVRISLADFFGGRVPYRAVELGAGWRSPIFDFEVGSMYGASAHVLEELLRLYATVKRHRFPEPLLTKEIPWQ